MNQALDGTPGAFALMGIRVLDLTWVHAGPAATRILADQGAEVIKVESSSAQTIAGGAAPQTPRGVGYRHNWNAGKLSLALNMKAPRAVALAKQLVAVSDVVAENFSSRVLSSWGMDYQELRRIRPDIVMLRMSGFGRTGPWKDYVSFGQTLQASSGFTHLTGFPDTDPCGPASAYCDAVAGMAGAQAVLLALIHRTRTGQGQCIDLSQLESLSALLETLVLDLSVNRPGEIQRAGNRLPYSDGIPHGVYRCQDEDRWVAITVFNDAEWEALVAAMGRPSWATEERFSTVAGRHRHEDDVDRLTESWTLQHSAEEVMERLQASGVSAGVVQSGADLAERDPQLRARHFFRQVPDETGTLRSIEAAPYTMSRTPGGPGRGAPTFGAHQTYVLRDVLGVTDEELAECAVEGVFE